MSTDKNNGGPAFPREDYQTNDAPGQRGMSLRDYFAAKALLGILHDAELFWEGAAPLAYQYADAMLKAREL